MNNPSRSPRAAIWTDEQPRSSWPLQSTLFLAGILVIVASTFLLVAAQYDHARSDRIELFD